MAYKYEVRKNGHTYMGTEYEACRYPPEAEASIQAAGYDIFINGKKLPKRKLTAARGGARK